MTQLSLAPNFVRTIRALIFNANYFGRKTPVFRGFTYFLIVTLLAQVLLIGPIPRSKAAFPNQSLSAPVSAPPEAFMVSQAPHNRSSRASATIIRIMAKISRLEATGRLPLDGM